MTRISIEMDTSVAALLVRTGARKWDYGALATVRSLGRSGVAVHVMADQSERELVASAYTTSVLRGPFLPEEPRSEQVAVLNRCVRALGQRTALIAGDDESAVLIAEMRSELDPLLLTFPVSPELPRQLAGKGSLHHLCMAAAVPTPAAAASTDPATLREFAARHGFPLVAKNPEPYDRLDFPAVERTTILVDGAELDAVLAKWDQKAPLMLQQYVEPSRQQEWYVAGVRGADGQWLGLTGRKLAAHPAGTGVGWLNAAAPNPELAEQARHFAESTGYVGLFDSDWLVPPGGTTGAGSLIDFNPRRGAQFRLFQTTAGLDVVRAAHLLLSGRSLPTGGQDFARALTVGHLALQHPTLWWQSRRGRARGHSEGSWWARDDARPAAAMGTAVLGRAAGMAVRRVWRASA